MCKLGPMLESDFTLHLVQPLGKQSGLQGDIQAGSGAPCQLWGVKEGSPPPLGDPAETSKTRLFPEEHLLCFEGWRDREFWFPTNY